MILHDLLLVENNERGEGFMKFIHTTRNTANFQKNVF